MNKIFYHGAISSIIKLKVYPMSNALEPSNTAPDFASVDQNNNPVKLADFAGRFLVLFFYPKDDTPGCTIENQEFTAHAAQFTEVDAAVVGVSRDDCASHRAFIEKFGLNVTLLADTAGELCESYGVWQEVERDGQKSMRIVRSTFVINPQGQLAHVEYGLKDVKGHAAKILQFIKSQQGG